MRLLGESGKLIPDMLIALGRSWLGDTGEIATLLRTTADPLSRRDEAFCLLARSDLPDDAAREQAFQAAFHRYRHLFLHGEPLEEGRDLRLWQENEAAARALVRAWKQRGSDTPCNQHEQVAAEYHEAERRVLGRLGRLQRAVFRYVLSVARRYVLLRSQSREPVLLAGLLERDAVREVGRRLQEAGIVSSADEAFLLEARELIDWLKGSLPRDMLVRIINERRDLYRRWWRYSPPDVIDLEKTVEAPLELSEEAGEMLPGRPISPGRAEGRARVVNTLGEATNILPGEVLVCQEPLFELSPWFGLVAGVVSERGGLLDHAAVLVREYSVPAVFGVEQVTQRVHTGDELLVDATRGVVVRRYKEPDWELL